MSKKKVQSAGTPVRIAMNTQRYEVCASLFDTVFRRQIEESGLQPMTPDEELELGIMPDDEGEDGYYVKPADPDVIRAQLEERESEAVETLDLITEGTIFRLTDPETGVETVTVAYDESELTGMAGSRTTIIHRSDDPGLVTMIRSGMVNTALTFRAHHRSVCTYDTPYMPFQIGIHGIAVDNRIVSDGVLVLDYIIEIRGARAERTRMEMKISPM